MKELLAAATLSDDEAAAGREAADRLAYDWDNRDWVPLSPTREWARAATNRLGEIISSQPTILRASLRGADRGASTLSPRPFQGLIECLQNADDLGASTLHIAYRSKPHPELLIVHDGEPVTFANVGAMLLPWLSTKDADAAAAGRFGIGQRTLGALGSPITLHASPFHFVMDEDGPISIEPYPDVDGVYKASRRDTMLVIPLLESVTSDKVVEAVRELNADSLIFLRSIHTLQFHHLEDPSQDLLFAVEVTPQQNGRIEFDEDVAVVEIADVDVHFPAGVVQSYRRYSTRRAIRDGEMRSNKATDTSTPIGVCVPMSGLSRPLRLYDRMPLPEFTGLSIGFNAQFDPDAARSTLLPNTWNRNRFTDLGQLLAWAALETFRAGSITAWNHVPLRAEADKHEGWTANQVRELIVDASHFILRNNLTLLTGYGETSVDNIAYEAEALEALLSEQDVELLTEGKVALPHCSRDVSGRWRLVLGELDRSEIVEVQDALQVVDGDPKRGVDWYVLFAAIAERHGYFDTFISQRSLILADGTTTAKPKPTDIWVLVKTASPTALSTRLGLARQLHPAYFNSDAGTLSFLSKLKNQGALFDDRDTGTDVFAILERGASSISKAPTTIMLEDEYLLELRDAWAVVPRERHADLGQKVGQRIELKAIWYDTDGKRVTGWSRPVEMYQSASIDRDKDSFASAAFRTPGLKWVDSGYAKVLKQSAGRSAIGAQRLLSAWGVAREPRLIRPKDEYAPYLRDPRPVSPIKTHMRTADQLHSIQAGGYSTHLLDDHWSPDAEAVAANITIAPAKARKKRAMALLSTLSRAWEKHYSDSATARTAYGYYGYWSTVIEIRATWLARLADIKWMPDAGNGLQRPLDLQVQIPGNPPRQNERSSTVAKLDPQILRSGILAALGVKAGPTQMDLIEQLRTLRKEPVAESVVADALAIYQLLAASLRNKSDGFQEGRMTAAQLKNAFRAGSEGQGLLLVGGKWLSPETLLRGPAIFGARRGFAPNIDGLEPLWSDLGVKLPIASDAIAVLKEIAKGQPSPEDLGIAIRALTLLSNSLVDMKPQIRTNLRRLPLWTGSEWTTERPVYVLEGEALLSCAPTNIRIWRPGFSSFGTISTLLEALGVVRLIPADFRPVSIPEYGIAEGDSIRPIFAKGVALLRQELVKGDQALLDGLTVDWEHLIAAPVVVDPNLSIVTELISGSIHLQARAHVGREPLSLIVRSLSDAGTAEGAGAAIASLFEGDRQKVAWAWAAIWPRAVTGEQAEGAVLPKTRVERGEDTERLKQLAKQVSGRKEVRQQIEKSRGKTHSALQPVQVRKLRDLGDLVPSVGIVINEGTKPSGKLIFAKRRHDTGTRQYDPNIPTSGLNDFSLQRTVLPPATCQRPRKDGARRGAARFAAGCSAAQ